MSYRPKELFPIPFKIEIGIVSVMETTSSDSELEAAEEAQDHTYHERVLFSFSVRQGRSKLSEHHPLCIKKAPVQSNNW